MPRLDPAVAATRLAVRRTLAARDTSGAVLVACSGGADSLALLAATVFELRREPARVVGAVIDHGLQDGSADHTTRVAAQMRDLGVDESLSVRVEVDAASHGVEAGARRARYAALSRLARECGAGVGLLGHTLDDQAETVLLGLTQGSGPRSIAGMPLELPGLLPGDGEAEPVFLRPFLAVTRVLTEQACRAQGIEWWEDPHNRDPRFVRSRVRHTVLPLLEEQLGPGVAAALARTGELLRDDLAALDAQARAMVERHSFAEGIPVGDLEGRPHALVTRGLRLAALRAGCPARDLTRDHVLALADLLTRRRGEDLSLDLPGGVTATRRDGVLRMVGPVPGFGHG